MESLFEFYEISNQVNGWGSECTGRYLTFDAARAALKSKRDFWSKDDTGKIYKTTYKIDFDTNQIHKDKQLVFERTQVDAIHNNPGTDYRGIV